MSASPAFAPLEAGADTLTVAVAMAVLDALGFVLAVGPRPALDAVPDAVVLRTVAGAR